MESVTCFISFRLDTSILGLLNLGHTPPPPPPKMSPGWYQIYYNLIHYLVEERKERRRKGRRGRKKEKEGKKKRGRKRKKEMKEEKLHSLVSEVLFFVIYIFFSYIINFTLTLMNQIWFNIYIYFFCTEVNEKVRYTHTCFPLPFT